MGADLISHFAALGSKCTELDAGEKLRVLHDFYRQGEEAAFHFDPQDMMKKGHDFKDYICPDSIEKSLHMQMHRLYDPIVEERFRNTNQLVRQAVRYIDANYRKQITLSDMADALQVSPFYLSKLLNNSLHKTFTELVSERRGEASKELLKSGKRIKEIAYEVGFQGQNYFTKIFKKYTGVTPKMYKNSFDDK